MAEDKVPTISNPGAKAIDAFKAARTEGGTVALWVTREDLAGTSNTATARFLKENLDAVRQPEFGPRDEKGRTPRTGNELVGQAGVDALTAGYGERSKIRKLAFDVDLVEARYKRGRKADKDQTLGAVLSEHDARSMEHAGNLNAGRAAQTAARAAKKGRGAEVAA